MHSSWPFKFQSYPKRRMKVPQLCMDLAEVYHHGPLCPHCVTLCQETETVPLLTCEGVQLNLPLETVTSVIVPLPKMDLGSRLYGFYQVLEETSN